MRIAIPMLFAITLTGCGATVHSQLIMKGSRLGNYERMHLIIATTGDSVSVTGTGMGSGLAKATMNPAGVSVIGMGSGLSVSHAMSSNDQVLMAAQDVAFALRELGFKTVDKPEEADAIALFSIGTVRYDPLAGWIADRAFLEFKEGKTQSMILSIKADSQLITPTVATLVDNLVSEVKRHR